MIAPKKIEQKPQVFVPFCRVAVLLVGILVCLSARPSFAKGVDEPFRNAREALVAGQFQDAEKWFSIAYRDFPNTDQGRKALLHRIILIAAEELSSVRMSSLWNEGASLAQVENTSSDFQKQKGQLYEEKAFSRIEQLKEAVPHVLKLSSDDLNQMTLEIHADVSGWEVEKLRARIQKGEILKPDEIEKVERGEMVTNYLGFVSTVLELGDQDLFKMPLSGSLKPASFFNALGTRLYIAQRGRKRRDLRQLSEKCYEKVIDLTKGSPYDKERQRALDALEKIVSEAAGKKSGKKTPSKE